MRNHSVKKNHKDLELKKFLKKGISAKLHFSRIVKSFHTRKAKREQRTG